MNWGNFTQVADGIIRLVDLTVPVLVGLALVAFFWGAGKSILNADSPEARTQGRTFMVYGLISLFIILSIWGILKIALNTLF